MKKLIDESASLLLSIFKIALSFLIVLTIASGALYAIMGLFYLIKFFLFGTKIF